MACIETVFAGLHNQGKRILLILDEASSISDRIYEVAEGALTDQDTEIIWLVCGNPTLNISATVMCKAKVVPGGSWTNRTTPGSGEG
jgi:hypothetical protein